MRYHEYVIKVYSRKSFSEEYSMILEDAPELRGTEEIFVTIGYDAKERGTVLGSYFKSLQSAYRAAVKDAKEKYKSGEIKVSTLKESGYELVYKGAM